MLFFAAVSFMLILCVALFWWGYSEGKISGIQDGRKRLAEYVLGRGEQ